MSTEKTHIDFIALFGTFFTLIYCWWSRLGEAELFSNQCYIYIFFLSSTVLLLPSVLAEMKLSQSNWWHHEAFYSIVVILILAFLGIIIRNEFILNKLILILGLGTVFWRIRKESFNIKWLDVFSGIVFFIFFILLFYSAKIHSPVFPEKTALGLGYIDVLFHSSLSNMFETMGFPNTGLNGSVYFSYHFGSHVLLSGLNHWVGANLNLFYNIGYAAIFIPLFIKSLWLFTLELSRYKKNKPVSVFWFFLCLVILYSLNIHGIAYGQPLVSESLAVGIIFTLLFGTGILGLNESQQMSWSLIFFSFFMILLFCFFKISVGFVAGAGVVYLAFRSFRQGLGFALLAGLCMVISFIVYYFIFPEDMANRKISWPDRINNIWHYSEGIFSYLLGGVIAIGSFLSSRYAYATVGFYSMYYSKKYIFLEVLLVMTLAGMAGGIFASATPSNVFYFGIVQFFFAFAFLIIVGNRLFENLFYNKPYRNYFLVGLFCLSFLSKPAIATSVFETLRVKKAIASLDNNHKTLYDLILMLVKLDQLPDKQNYCIFIPHGEKWYYESQTYFPLGDAFIVPSFSGIPSIWGLTEEMQNAQLLHFNGNQKIDKSIALSEAIDIAKEKGYEKLYYFYAKEDNLQTEIITLD